MKAYLLKNKVSGTYLAGCSHWNMRWEDITTSNNLHIFYAEDLENMRISSSVWRVIRKNMDYLFCHPYISQSDLFMADILNLASDLVIQKSLSGIEELGIVFDIDLWGYIFDNLVVEEYDLANPGKPKQYPVSDYIPEKYKKQFNWWKSKQQQIQGVNP